MYLKYSSGDADFKYILYLESNLNDSNLTLYCTDKQTRIY